MIVGVTVLLILGLEAAYRLQASARRGAKSVMAAAPDTLPAPPFLFLDAPWANDYFADHSREEEVLWRPYVYVKNPTFSGTHMAVDSLGHRVTPHAPSSSNNILQVFFLGGSTTFGWYQRAEHTIPAEAARRLQELVGDSARVVVTNFGVPGQTFTQEIIELMLQLREGKRPDIVVFYDGINDVMAAIQNNQSGLPQNEANRSADFQRGRERAEAVRPGFRGAMLTAKRMGKDVLSRLQVAQRIVAVKTPPPFVRQPIDSLAASSVKFYVANVELVEALAARYGFQPIYVWQPALLSSNKPMTVREKWLRRSQPIGDLHLAVPPLLDPAMAELHIDHFIDATTLFDRDSLEVYTDVYGHTYERANPRIVDTLMPMLTSAIARLRAQRR